MSSVIAIFRFIIGAVFGIACALALIPAVTAFNPASGDSQGSALILLLVILGAVSFLPSHRLSDVLLDAASCSSESASWPFRYRLFCSQAGSPATCCPPPIPTYRERRQLGLA